MATFWDEDGTSGWAETAVQAAKPVTSNVQQRPGGWDSVDYVDPAEIERQRIAAEMQAAHTAKNAMSRDDFLKKYGKTFVADDKGGNAASEVAGQDVGAYYDRWLDPKRTLVHGVASRGYEAEYTAEEIERIQGENVSGWGSGYKYRDAHPYFDAWDNVNPHPESQDLGGAGEFWRQIGRPVATAAAMYAGVGALNGAIGGAGATTATGTGGSAGIGSGTVLGGGTATGATTAKGVAGILGMSPGYGATALNAGALNTGMSLARGNNIGDAIKSGVTSAVLSPIGGYVGDATTAGLGDTFNPDITKGIATFAGNTVKGGAQGAIDGTGILSGMEKGAASGILNASSDYVVDGITGNIDGFEKLSSAQQQMVKTTMSKMLQGKNPTKSLLNQIANAAMDKVTKQPKTGGWSA